MAILFIPQELELHKLAVDVTRTPEDIILQTEMDKGTHSRENGTATIYELDVELSFRDSNIDDLWMNWFLIVGARFFYSTYPDAQKKGFSAADFYCFSFKDGAPVTRKNSRLVYGTSISLYWHFLVPPLARG